MGGYLPYLVYVENILINEIHSLDSTDIGQSILTLTCECYHFVYVVKENFNPCKYL